MEEHHRTTELEVMLNVRVSGAYHLNGQLVQRVVIAASHLDWPPRLTALHLSLNAYLLGLLAKGFLFGLILQLQQESLLLECLDG